MSQKKSYEEEYLERKKKLRKLHKDLKKNIRSQEIFYNLLEKKRNLSDEGEEDE